MDSICAHFGECGGCQHQDHAYEIQLDQKSKHLSEIFGSFWDHPIPLEPSPDIWNYRNKVDFSFGPRQYPEKPPPGFVRDTVLGFNRPGKWYWPFDVEDCLIAPKGSTELLEAVRRWYRTENLRAFDSRTGAGELRILLVRDGKRTGQRMVAVVTSPGAFPTDSFVDTVRSAFDADSIHWGTFSRSARVAEAETVECLYGNESIDEEMQIPLDVGHRSLRFRISPFSFFQVNTRAAERLYGHVRRWVADVAPQVLYDLYGGSGGIALACADLVPVVRSVESVEPATLDGQHNAERNGVTNVFFETARVKDYLQNLRECGGLEPGAAVVVDPPRSGMVPKAVRRLVDLGPERILYVSCKPAQTASELPNFLERYDVEQIRAVDLFPHTRHVEALVTMRRR